MGLLLFSRISSAYFKTINLSFVANYCTKMSKTAILLLAEGAEEMEAVITADVLRRAGVRGYVLFVFRLKQNDLN